MRLYLLKAQKQEKYINFQFNVNIYFNVKKNKTMINTMFRILITWGTDREGDTGQECTQWASKY